ncbi:MAG: hypothetical protein ISQ13_03140 [Candidatus Margulisbacteria bacterium]|nr:hypothetical protein [Candidatus Margulisiibacteriota bacterium]
MLITMGPLHVLKKTANKFKPKPSFFPILMLIPAVTKASPVAYTQKIPPGTTDGTKPTIADPFTKCMAPNMINGKENNPYLLFQSFVCFFVL